jgi:hypothetical protein
VESVEIDADSREARVKYTGSFEGLVALESAASTARVPAMLLSPAEVTVNLKAKTGADRKKAETELAAVTGVRSCKILSAFNTLTAKLTVDLRGFRPDAVAQAAANAAFDAKFAEPEWVTVTLSSGDASKLAREVAGLKGVLEVDAAGDDIRFWARKVGDDAIRKLAEKAGAAIAKIARS